MRRLLPIVLASLLAPALDVPEHSFDVERRGHSKWSEIKRRKGAG